MPVFSAAVRVGLSSDTYATALGGIIPVSVRLADLDGHGVSGTVVLKLIATHWNAKEGRNVDRELTQTLVHVGGTGSALATLPAGEEGDLRVEAWVKDGTGRLATAMMGTFVAGPSYKPQKADAEPRIELKTSKRSYALGEKVSAFVWSNHPERPILMTLEGREIWRYEVLQGRQQSRAWAFKANLELSPNGFVAASQWSDQGPMTATQVVPVPDRTRELTVRLGSDKPVYRPGETAHISVTTLDQSSKPVPAEVAVSVVDEAIFALSPDVTPGLYRTYWGRRANEVTLVSSAPEEVSGGAYQRVEGAPTVRQRFEDTAYWNAFVTTGPTGTSEFSFQVPGNLTTWRLTARAIDLGSAAGESKSSVMATLPLTLRLATPRQMVEGDDLTLVGTLNNRTSDATSVATKLTGSQVSVAGPGSSRVNVAAHGQSTVQWPLHADGAGGGSQATLDGEALSSIGSDALRVGFPIVPRAVQMTTTAGTVVTGSGDLDVELPKDAFTRGSTGVVRVGLGPSSIAIPLAKAVLGSPRYGSLAAAYQLEAAVVTGPATAKDSIREALALLSRTEQSGGWGWWENSPVDSVITARVTSALAMAKLHGIAVPDNMLMFASGACVAQFNSTNLWEYKALLACAAAEASRALLAAPGLGAAGTADAGGIGALRPRSGPDVSLLLEMKMPEKLRQRLLGAMAARARSGPTIPAGLASLMDPRALLAGGPQFVDASMVASGMTQTLLDQVIEHATNLSPYARLRIAEVLGVTSPKQAETLVSAVEDLVSSGPVESTIPLGYGVGWTASESETDAQLLLDLLELKRDPQMQVNIARHLAGVECSLYESGGSQVAVALALKRYGQDHPSAAGLGPVSASVNGVSITLKPSSVGPEAEAELPVGLLHAGANLVHVSGSSSGEALVWVSAGSFGSNMSESTHGIRILRRYEIKNGAAVWSELTGTVKAGEPVRCTVVVWGDGQSDAIKVVEPLPAGFEFVDSEISEADREEVRDGALWHYLINSDAPATFRYYLRSESAGKMIALPAVAQYLRRPNSRGQTGAEQMVVHP